jgi:hypothetical protein
MVYVMELLDFDPRAIANELVKHGHDWADKNCAAEMLEETKTTLRSTLASQFIKEAGTSEKAKTLAEASPIYKEHIEAMVIARKESNKARVLYDSSKAYVDLIRSKESTLRAQMNLR